MKGNDPHIDIIQLVEQMPGYATAAFTVKKHKDTVAKVEIIQDDSYKNKEFDNRDYGTLVLRLINDAVERGFSGGLSFTVNMKAGQINQVIKTDHEEINYLQ